MCVGSQTPSQSALPITSLRCSNAEPWPNTLVLCAQTSCWSGPRACRVCRCCWREPQPCSSRGPTTRGATCAASSPRSSCPCSLWWLPWAWGHSGPRRLSTLSCCCLPPCMARLTRQTSLGECCSSGPCSEPFSWGQNEPFGVILSTAAVLHVARGYVVQTTQRNRVPDGSLRRWLGSDQKAPEKQPLCWIWLWDVWGMLLVAILQPHNSHRDFLNIGIYAPPPVWNEVPTSVASSITVLGSNSIRLVSIALLSVSTGRAFLARPCWSKANRQLEQHVLFQGH